jgi:esterase/lipase
MVRILLLFLAFMLGVSQVLITRGMASVATRDIVIVVHGLNLNPKKMQPLIQELSQQGLEVLPVVLPEHQPEFQADIQAESESGDPLAGESQHLTLTSAMQALEKVYEQAQQKVSGTSYRIYFLGYSLGGLLGAYFQCRHDNQAFDRMILLAPALKTKVFTGILKPIARLSHQYHWQYSIPSFSLPDYRARKGTSIQAYQTLFELIDGYEQCSQLMKHLNLSDEKKEKSTLIFIDPQDELVSYEGIVDLAQEHPSWSVQKLLIHSDEISHRLIHHLVIDEASVGKTEWNRMKKILQAFIR